MDMNELGQRLTEIHQFFASIAERKAADMKAARDWVNQCVRPAFDELHTALSKQRPTVESPDVDVSANDLKAKLTFTHNPTAKTLSYEISVQVSVKGVTGTTRFKLPGRDPYLNTSIEDILSWTKDEIFADFLKGYAFWLPE